MTKRFFIKLMVCIFTPFLSVSHSKTLEKNLKDLILEDVWFNDYLGNKKLEVSQ